MIDLDAVVRDIRYNDYPHDQVIVDTSDFYALVDEIKALREQVRALTAPSVPVQPQATKPSYYRHRLDANRLVRLLTYNLTTHKYHVEFYKGDGSPCHLNGYIDYAEMQTMYDLHNPVNNGAGQAS
jgi:hypothetical protein